MNKMRARAQIQFPTVLLTLISIIQALALELMWSKIVESEFLWSWSIQAIVGWGMISVVFMGILQIWVMYSTMVMGFVWQPMLRDSILPFILGMQEFMLISLIGNESSALWLFVLGSLVASGNYVAHSSFSRARKEEQNAQFFSTVEPAKLKDFAPAISIVAVLVLLATVIAFNNDQSWIVLLAILFANAVLFRLILGSRRLWRVIMGLSEIKGQIVGQPTDEQDESEQA